jgi:DNA-binding XRE family transcriptional regulator
MPRDSSAPKLRAADPLELPVEKPRAKPLRVLTPHTLASDCVVNRSGLTDSEIAARLRILRTESTLTQADAATVGGLSISTVGRLELGKVDLGHVRYVFALLDFCARQRSKQ